ncbi:hypothetical protein NBRC116598_08640 [Pseudophaeobacter arcticus]|uniref:Chemotaxis protein CheA n=1 Tax=Pseudophaeobacter arcticus TaxID=385492 RepID=A0ABQ0AHS5_9RHOB
MVHNNKVLTVSYGTFSCTLEGFEDSFGTMKAIAEYFRDLASDDRYFGAEPPQPDAEMLARIAQREVARQVEARTSSDGIHLRTTTPDAAPSQPTIAPQSAEPAAEPEQAPAAEPDRPARLAQDTIDVSPSEVDLFEEDDTQSEAPSEANTAAEANAAILADAPAQAAPAEQSQTGSIVESPAASVDLATIAAISAAVSDSPASEDPTMDDNTAEEVAEKVDFFDEDLPAEPVTSAPRSDTVPAADSIAAKLLRIRSVVAKAPEEEFSEDEHAETFIETARAEMAQVEDEDLEDIDAESDEISRVLDRIDLTGKRADAASAALEAEATSEPQTPAPSSEALINSVLQETAPDPVAEPTAAAQPVTQADTQADSRVDPQADSRAAQEPPARPKRGMRLGRPKASEDVALNTASDTSALDTTAAPSPAEEPAPTAPETAPQTAKPLRARIVKVKRADLEQAMSSGNLEEVVETPTDETPDSTPSAESSLDADEEADLMRELAEVEAELLASNQDSAQISEVQAETDAPSPKSAPEQAADSASAREVTSRANPQTTQPADSDVTRLMEAAESKLGDPDNATSRETYSHLRAAVAAAEADRSASPTGAKTDEAGPYREDLASVVRPRRPEAGEATRSRSTGSRTGSRPAPLKLVAEQRIEPEVKTSAKPVRPRRISMAADDTPSAQAEAFGSFTDYVQDLGATELHEMLEAAASYLSFVEGRDKFSRPQLMNKVRSVGHGDFNRENGLRSIGQLLREGKIERSDNGQFTATDDIGFRPRKRAAG